MSCYYFLWRSQKQKGKYLLDISTSLMGGELVPEYYHLNFIVSGDREKKTKTCYDSNFSLKNKVKTCLFCHICGTI